MPRSNALITGASRGIGAAVARRFADSYDHIAICARNQDTLSAVEADLQSKPADVLSMRADVRDEFDMEWFIESTARRGGPIDTIVPSAGVYHGSPGATPLADESYAAFDDTLRTNTRGVFTTIKEAIPHLAAAARILVPSNAIARKAKPGYGAYAISKAATEALARGFATELSATVTILDPGHLPTSPTADEDPEPATAEFFDWAAHTADETTLDGAVIDPQTRERTTQ